MSQVIGVVSPGAMGAALGRAWQATGVRVVCTVAGRSPRTQRLAGDLDRLASLDDVVAAADVVVSVCPPGQADEVGTAVLAACARHGARPVYADLNAISPGRVARLSDRVTGAGLDFVDGSISGGPPRPGGDTILYLAGDRADALAAPAPGLRPRVLGPDPGRASAVKMCTASVYKGTTALWAQAVQTAHELGVLEIVLEDLGEEFPELVRGLGRRVATATSKSGRFVAEMEEIATTQGAAGASPELFAGFAAVYRRLAATDLATSNPEEIGDIGLEEALGRLAGRSDPPSP